MLTRAGVLGGARRAVVTPVWVPQNLLGETATTFADYVNNRYWHDNTEYASEAAFNTAAGGQVSGVTRIVGPYVAPGAAELITNGGFGTDTTGWTPFSGAETLASVSGELQITATAASNPGAEQQFPSLGVALSQAFRLRGTTRRGTIASGSVGYAYSSSAVAISSVSANVTVNTDLEVTFAAEESSLYMKVQTRLFGSGKTGTYYSDNISVKECLPHKGFTQGLCSGFVAGRTPASGSGTVVVFELNGDTGARNRIRCEYNIATGAMTGYMQYKATGATFTLGTVANDTNFQINFTAKNNGRAMWLSNGHAQFYNSGTVPGFPKLYIGRSNTGETWTGTITSWGMYPDMDRYGDAYVMEGDSYVAGSGGVVLKTMFPTITRRLGYGGGAGGDSMTGIKTRLLGASYSDFYNMVVILWDGSANGAVTAASYCDLIADGIAPYRDFVVLAPAVWQDQAAPDTTLYIAIRDEMLVRWPTKTIDWRNHLPNTAGVLDISNMLSINATAMVNGQQYRIKTAGTTDYTLVGAANNNVNTLFTATGPGTGTGTVINYGEVHLDSPAMTTMAGVIDTHMTGRGL